MAENKNIAVMDSNREALYAPPIKELIYEVREQYVMIDRDLSVLYQVETGYLNRQVKRNRERFPSDFMFQLTREEYQFLKCQNGISRTWGGDHRAFPYAFTQNGIAMLSSVLRSPAAIEVNIRIMREFTAMRHLLTSNFQIFQRIETLENHQLSLQEHQQQTDKRLSEVFKLLDEQMSLPPQQGIFFDGQIFDAYTLVSDLIRQARQTIVLIDNYVDDSVLKMLDKRQSGVSAKIYTKDISQQLSLDLQRHNAQYPAIVVEQFNRSHDRFLLIDDEVYHVGASLKDLGKKWFAIMKMTTITATQLLSNI